MRVNRVATSLVFLLLIAAAPSTRPTLPRDIRDLANTSHRLLAGKATVLFFVGTECPVSNGYVPEMNRIAEAYAGQGIACYAVYAGADVTAAAAGKHAKEFAIALPAVIDPKCELADAVGATTTIEAAVVLADGSLAYRGRVDDTYVAFGRKKLVVLQHDVRDVLDDVVAGRRINPRTTTAVGCLIVRPEKKR